MDLKNILILFLLIAVIIKFNKKRKEKFNQTSSQNQDKPSVVPEETSPQSSEKLPEVSQTQDDKFKAYVAIGKDNNVQLYGDNLDLNGNINFNSNKTTFKGANGASSTHFPYVESDGTSLYNYISGPTIFREGSITFNDNITINSELNINNFSAKNGTISNVLAANDINISGKITGNTLETSNFSANNGIISSSLNVRDINISGKITGNSLEIANLNTRNGTINGSFSVNSNLSVNGEINALGGLKPTWSNSWAYSSSNRNSAMISKNSISDGTYLVIGIGSRNFTGMTTFTKKGRNITSSVNNNLVVEGNNDNKFQGGAMWVRCSHPTSMNMTVMYIKITNMTN